MTRCLSLVEIKCQQPVVKPHAKTLWDGSPHIGSVVYYQCEEGFYTRSLRNYSVCGENGLWEDIDLLCEGATFDHRHIQHDVDVLFMLCSNISRNNLAFWGTC